MAHPIENAFCSSTSPQRQIFQLINHWMNDPTATIVASTALRHSDRDCVTLFGSPTPSVPHKNPPSTASWPCVSSASLCAATEASVSALRPFASPTLASYDSAQLPAASASTSQALRCLFGTNSSSLQCIHCPSLLITNSLLLSNPALAKWMTDHSGVFPNWPLSLFLYFSCWSINSQD